MPVLKNDLNHAIFSGFIRTNRMGKISKDTGEVTSRHRHKL
jgi:hypothetical protein